jgi:hypothetical protein
MLYCYILIMFFIFSISIFSKHFWDTQHKWSICVLIPKSTFYLHWRFSKIIFFKYLDSARIFELFLSKLKLNYVHMYIFFKKTFFIKISFWRKETYIKIKMKYEKLNKHNLIQQPHKSISISFKRYYYNDQLTWK